MPQLRLLHVTTMSEDPSAESKTGYSQINKFFFYRKKEDAIVQQGIVWALMSYGFFLTVPVGMWGLRAPPGIKPVPPTVEALSLNHQAARGSPCLMSL